MRIRLIILFFFASIAAYAQIHEQRVFLWDVSESLNSNGMWEHLQDALISSINAIEECPENEIVLVPFYPTVISEDIIMVKATKEGKTRIIDAIKSKGNKAVPIGNRKTNIVAAIQKFHALAKPNYKNYMFLYTDGANEIGDLSEELQSWNYKNSENNKFGFYVLVNPAADTPIVRSAEMSQDNFWVVPNANVNIKICNLPTRIIYNIKNDTNGVKVITTGDNVGTEHISFTSDDSLYNVELLNDAENKESCKIRLEYKGDNLAPAEYEFLCKANAVGCDNYTFITPNIIKIKAINKPERVLNVSIK